MDSKGAITLQERSEPFQVVPLQEVIDRFDLLSVEQSHILAVDRDAPIQMSASDNPNFVNDPELGQISGTGATIYQAFRQDYNPRLRHPLANRVWEQMRRGDGQVAMSLRALKTPVLAARWYMQPTSTKKRDAKIADQVWRNLTQQMTTSWPALLTEALNFVDFGHYGFEKVWDVLPDGTVYLRKLATLHPLDLYEWTYDAYGGPTGGWFYNDNMLGKDWIPIDKAVVFVLDREGGFLDGRSALRPAYKHWFYKENLYKVDAIQKERHGIGIPVIKLPPNYTSDDKKAAEQLGRNLRTNEKAHVVLPPLWDLMFADLQGHPVNCMTSIEHHDTQIARSVGAFWLSDTPGAGVTDPQELFLKGTRFIAEVMRDCFNKWVIPELVNYNYPTVDDYPELRVRRLGDTVDWRQYSFAIRNLIGAGVIRPDDKLEAWIRDEMDLPDADPDTARDIGTPQLAGTAMITSKEQAAKGVPQQSTAANMNIGPGSANTGKDGGGASGT